MDRIDVPVTGPASTYVHEAPPAGHIDRTAELRRVAELRERYRYAYRRLEANLVLDVRSGQSDLDHLRQGHRDAFGPFSATAVSADDEFEF